MFLFKDKGGNWCGAKTLTTLTWLCVMYELLTNSNFNWAGAATFLAPFMALWWGRNHTKELVKNEKPSF